MHSGRKKAQKAQEMNGFAPLVHFGGHSDFSQAYGILRSWQ